MHGKVGTSSATPHHYLDAENNTGDINVNELLSNFRLSNLFAFAICLCLIFPGLNLAQDDDKKGDKDETKVEAKADQDKDDDQDSDEKESDEKEDDEEKEPTLKIGSKAPAIDIEDWISDNDGLFEHITEFEEGKVYVIEFTSILDRGSLSMGINERLQRKHENDDVRIISIWAHNRRFVENFMKREIPNDSEGRTFGDLTGIYCVTSDQDGSVAKDYFAAAGQVRLPTSFIIGKTGRIEWIGQPFGLEKPLEQVVEEKWDREAFKPNFAFQTAMGSISDKIGKKLVRQDFDGAIDLLEKNIEKYKDDEERYLLNLNAIKSSVIEQKIGISIREFLQDDDQEGALERLNEIIDESENNDVVTEASKIRISFLARFKMDGAADAMKEFAEKHNDDSEKLNNMSWELYELHEALGVEMDVLKVCLKAAERAVKLSPEKGYIQDTLAHFVYIVEEDLDRAIKIQKKAVELTEKESTSDLSTDQLNDLKAFLTKLENERKNGKKKKPAKPKESDF